MDETQHQKPTEMYLLDVTAELNYILTLTWPALFGRNRDSTVQFHLFLLYLLSLEYVI